MNDVLKHAHKPLVNAHAYLSTDKSQIHKRLSVSIMDSGNNRAHIFRSLDFFPLGVRYHHVTIHGIHGAQSVRVGVGVATFVTPCINRKDVVWRVPNSLYNPKSPVNLLCVNKFHYSDLSCTQRTGHKWDVLEEQLHLKDGSIVPVGIDETTHLPIVTTRPISPQQARENSSLMRLYHPNQSIQTHISMLNHKEQDQTLSLFTHTHLNPLTTELLLLMLNNPDERRFNLTLKHRMISGLPKDIKRTVGDKSQRPDSWYSGKMTKRHVPGTSRRPPSVAFGRGTHIVGDIGVVPVPDRYGNKYWALYKCLYTQFRVIYRMKLKSEIVETWKMFIADHSLQEEEGEIRISAKFLVTDDDQCYVAGKVQEYNREKMIGKWTIAPQTHNANPAESEMRRTMENAVSALYSSGLPPSFLLDALENGISCSNMVYTDVYHEEQHRFQAPYQRMKGVPPHVDNLARFGCKTYVFVDKADRVKHDAHSWVGWYIGVSQNMLASRVYRPIKHTVYDRFHTLYDNSVVYGDFLGAACRTRLRTETQQREYYNEEVKSLLARPAVARDAVLQLMQAQPWAPQPDPVEARVAKRGEPPTDQLGSAQRARVETAAGTGSGIATVHSNSEVGDGEGVLVPDSENLVSPAPRRTFSRTGRGIRETDEQAQERSSVHTPNPSADHERPMFTPGDRVTAAQAADFLRGVDTHTKIAWMAAVELTVNFFLTVDSLVVDSNDDLSFSEIEEFASNECCDSDQMCFIQLS